MSVADKSGSARRSSTWVLYSVTLGLVGPIIVFGSVAYGREEELVWPLGLVVQFLYPCWLGIWFAMGVKSDAAAFGIFALTVLANVLLYLALGYAFIRLMKLGRVLRIALVLAIYIAAYAAIMTTALRIL